MNVVIILISLGLIVASIVVDIKRIKSNKELIKKYNEVLISHKELGSKLDSRAEINKEIYEKIENTRKNFVMIKDNLLINYDHLAEEVVKRINENNKDITLTIDGEVIGKVAKGVLGN